MEYNYMEDNKPKNKKDNLTKKAGNALNNYMSMFLAIGISLVWLLGGFFNPSFSDTPIWIRLASSALSIVVSVSLASVLGMQGLVKGYSLDEVVWLQDQHIKAIEEANEYSEYADEWAEQENNASKKRARTHMLSEAGLKYSTYFDEDGDYTGVELTIPEYQTKETMHQYNERVNKLNAAITIKLTPQTFASISTDAKIDYDEFAMEDAPETFHKKQTVKKFASKILTVSLLSLVTFEIVVGRNAWESLFNGAMQLVVFLAFGIIDYLKNYNYVRNNYARTLRMKISSAKRLIAFGKSKRGEENGIKLQRYGRQPEETSRPSEGFTAPTSTIGV